MAALREYEPQDFKALYRLDQSCFRPGIAYSKTLLRYFLTLPSANCTVAEVEGKVAGFLLTEENPPLAHLITLDVAENQRRSGLGSQLLAASEKALQLRGVRHILLETAVDNEAAIAFWQAREYRVEAVLKRYYLGRIDAYEMRKILPRTPPNGTQPGETI